MKRRLFVVFLVAVLLGMLALFLCGCKSGPTKIPDANIDKEAPSRVIDSGKRVENWGNYITSEIDAALVWLSRWTPADADQEKQKINIGEHLNNARKPAASMPAEGRELQSNGGKIIKSNERAETTIGAQASENERLRKENADLKEANSPRKYLAWIAVVFCLAFLPALIVGIILCIKGAAWIGQWVIIGGTSSLVVGIEAGVFYTYWAAIMLAALIGSGVFAAALIGFGGLMLYRLWKAHHVVIPQLGTVVKSLSREVGIITAEKVVNAHADTPTQKAIAAAPAPGVGVVV